MQAANHMVFIVAAYAAAVIIVGGLMAWVMLDHRVQRRTLADLENSGLRRRSGAARSARPMAPAQEDA